ncbi:hypothetical protein CEP88_06460 [Roseobacter denitrificans]|uniref:B12-binding domain-containing protein n=1 Tax=Roseobacter denitrificans (strain ATCC 33942 / OCh 114) TaxID=375451 RepID=Q163H2_ROSDO|nr:cobalamin B12-binding domain-containing protein [Roseobacter denitrificans]ABG32871.1 conserved hypothetical protein [Roseobacter denitrificans OCh 114]AVL52269.1 hypothetical protein CEP88_06460 [Roseobacter denitrificans]SFF96002.1 B12 binding domain-containing protein [Roseobacter denitrificans OCh 114]
MPDQDSPRAARTQARYHRVQTDVLQLKSRLPQADVGDIVSEVLNRVTALRKANGDRVNLPTRQKVERLCYALISDDMNEGAAFIHDVQEDGATLEAVYLNYLAEAAAILGEWWDDDHVTFLEVIIGSSRIYAIMRDLGYLFVPDRLVEVKSAIFATVPHETHVLGVQMAADLFGAEGWNIEVMSGLPHETLVEQITQSPFHILGLSAGGAHSAGALARLIVAVRLARPDMRIFLSGQIVRTSPDLVAVMDIDGATNDIEEAKHILHDLWLDSSAQAG